MTLESPKNERAPVGTGVVTLEDLGYPTIKRSSRVGGVNAKTDAYLDATLRAANFISAFFHKKPRCRSQPTTDPSWYLRRGLKNL